jgi:hypothetical protein
MHRYFLTFLFLFSSLFGQSESQIGWIAKFGAAGGFSPMIIFPNFDEINPNLTQLGMSKMSGPLITWGGGGYAYVMLIDNLRLGGYGFSGSQSEKSTLNSLNNEVVYSLGGGAVTVEYTMPFIKKIAVSAGVMIGGGSLEIDVYQNRGDFTWNGIWDDFYTDAEIENKEFSMKNSFFFVSPTVNVDLPVNRFLAIRGGLGYQFTFGRDWEISNGKSLDGVPSGLNADGLFIQTGLLIGLFAF